MQVCKDNLKEIFIDSKPVVKPKPSNNNNDNKNTVTPSTDNNSNNKD